jgi:hypothetical protein
MRSITLACCALLLSFAGSAAALPVARSAQLTLTVGFSEVSETVAVSNPAAMVTVDELAGTLSLAAGLLTGTDSVPVTSTTSVAGLSLTVSTQASAVLQLGGATGLEPACPVGGPDAGAACAVGTGLGGDLGLVGFLNVSIVPGVATYQFPLGPHPDEDHAPFTLKTALARLPGGTLVSFQGTVSTALSQISLVSPTNLGLGVYAVRRLTIAFSDGLGLPGFVLGVPEPVDLALIASGVLGLLSLARRPQ